MRNIAWIADIGSGERESVGGKGQGLAELAAGGFRVPRGFVITTAATCRIAPGAWPAELREATLAAWRALAPAGEPVAVRSSATAEDGAGASYAGQHLTVLDVTGEDALLAAVESCLASLHSEAAAAYRAHAREESAAARMAVVVQLMVASRVAGVAFSVDPLTGDRARIVVEGVRGKGEALVSGVAEGERFVFAREGLAVLEEHHTAECALDVGTARAVAALALAAEQQFGGPQDIEFACDESGPWLLQSRAVTAAGGGAGGWTNEFDTPTGPDERWTSANVQEVLPGLLTPLTISLFSESVHRAYTVGYQDLGLLDRDEWPMFVGIFYNRAFLNVGATRLIAERSFGSSGDAVEHRYLGGEYRKKARRENTLRNWKFRVRSLVPLVRTLVGLTRAADRIERETHAREAEVKAIDAAGLSGPELDALRRELYGWVADIFRVHLQASGAAGGGFDMVSRMVSPILGDATEGRLPALFTGMRGVESAAIGLDLWELSRVAIRQGMAGAVRAPGFDPAAPGLAPEWAAHWQAFISRHGHRGLNEMEPAALTWRADPAPVLAVVSSYLDLDPSKSPPAMLDRQERERLRLEASLKRRMNPVTRRVFAWSLKQAQQWVALRERTKSIVVRAMRISDYCVPSCQARLLEAGAIDSASDMFFLSNAELSRFLLGEAEGGFQAAVRRRRREYERNRHVVLPERFRGHPAPVPPDLSHHSGDVLTGTPVSPGAITGRARVVHDPGRDGPLLPGEVLVAPVTDAGWTPLFALASGLVVDMGSALSHGSTVAREYGLPAVVNVHAGTTRIHTGDLVRVDGTAGMVTILEAAS